MSEVFPVDPSGKIEFRLLTVDKIEDVMKIQAETMRQECIAIGVGMLEEPGAPEEMLTVFREVIKDGITMLAIDTDTQEVAAVAFNKIHVRPGGTKDPFESFLEENLRHESCIELVKFLDDVESSVNIFDKYKVDGAMEIFYIGTNPRYQGRGIGRMIVEASIRMARGLRSGTTSKVRLNGDVQHETVVPGLVFGVFASSYSQRIVERLGFDLLTVVRYENYFCRGRKMSERIGEAHETAKLAVLEL